MVSSFNYLKVTVFILRLGKDSHNLPQITINFQVSIYKSKKRIAIGAIFTELLCGVSQEFLFRNCLLGDF